MRRCGLVSVMVLLGLVNCLSAAAAASFADPQFQAQWQQGEALAPNFWGPLATTRDGQQEPYKEAQGGQRLVQYFDKGRMEITGGKLTNGLLASEIVKGQIQIGDATFQPKPPPTIPIAGDPDNAGPTYAHLGTKAAALLGPTPNKVGDGFSTTVSASGDVTYGVSATDPKTRIAAVDAATQHAVPSAFADYRTKAGLQTIGLAISDPFLAAVKVAGQQKQVMIQVFERRVLTYTATNDPAFQVEMGNIGQHYSLWRYSNQSASPPPAAAPPATSALTQTFSDPAGRFTMHYPNTWHPAPFDNAPDVVFLLGGPGVRALSGLVQPNAIDLDTAAQVGKGVLMRDAAYTSVVAPVQTLSIGGEPARMLTSMRTKNANPSEKWYDTAWVVNHSGYIFIFVSVSDSATLDETSAIIGSVTFTNAPPTAPAPPAASANRISGTGQNASNPITLPSGVFVLTFTHTGRSNFIVKSYDSSGKSNLLINEIGMFSGKRWLDGDQTYTFDIKADGAWTISWTLIGRQSDSAFSGRGYDVSGVFTPPSGPTVYEFTHTGQSNFIVHFYCDKNSFGSLVQNEIGKVSASRVVPFPSGATACFWDARGDGNWSIKPRA